MRGYQIASLLIYIVDENCRFQPINTGKEIGYKFELRTDWIRCRCLPKNLEELHNDPCINC